MPIILKDVSTISEEALAALQGSSRVSNVANGTIVQAIVNAVSVILANGYQDLTASVAETYLSTASGSSLDFIGSMLGLPRGGSTLATRQNVQKFYVLSGNFGSLPGIGALNNVIPNATVVQSSDGSIQYQTVGSTPFTNTDTSILVTVKALTPGSAANVGVNVLTTHNLPVTGLLTTNIAAITNGDDTQTDNEYRFALSQAVTAAEAANEISVKLAALAVQGVADAIIIPYFYGVGTYSIIVVGTTPVVDQAILNSVLNLVKQVTALGEYVTVRAPRYIGVDIAAHLIFNASTLEVDKPIITNQVLDNLYDYINNIPIGQGLIRDQIIATILNTSSTIQDVENDPTDSDVMKIGIWTPTTVDIVNGVTVTNRIRQDLPENYTAYFDDKLIVEQDVQGFTHTTGYNPITITWE